MLAVYGIHFQGVRLKGSRKYGRVEILHNGEWGTICRNYWDINDARVVCRELGFPDVVAAYSGSTVVPGVGRIWFDNTRCNGDESSIFECAHGDWGAHNCRHSSDVGVRCSTNVVRLISSYWSDPKRVEVFHNGSWGTVCDNSWDINDAQVVCQQLGYTDAKAAYGGSKVGDGTGQIWLSNVDCTGNEKSLFECLHSGWGRHTCRHNQDAGLRCKNAGKQVLAKKTLRLGLKNNFTDVFKRDTQIIWYYYDTVSLNYVRILWIRWLNDGYSWRFYNDLRTSPGKYGSLLLTNTTIDDSGIYRYTVRSYYLQETVDYVVSVKETSNEVNAEISCHRDVTLRVGEDFSCHCRSVSHHSNTTATWIKSGQNIMGPTTADQKLEMRNISKDAAGTYVCRAQLNGFISEKTTEITVLYQPTIISFKGFPSHGNSITLSCAAQALPEATYKIFVNNTEIQQKANGIVMLSSDNHLDYTATYSCTAINNLGTDTWKLHLCSLKDVTCGLNVEISCTQNATLNEGEDFACLCKVDSPYSDATTTWVKNGHNIMAPVTTNQKLKLRKITTKDAGTYVCRAQRGRFTAEKTCELTVLYDNTLQEEDQSTQASNKNSKWYFSVIAAVGGIIFGIGFLYALQRLFNRQSRVKSRERPVGFHVNNPVCRDNVDTGMYEEPATTIPSQPVYEELDLGEFGQDIRENQYQGLEHQPRRNNLRPSTSRYIIP